MSDVYYRDALARIHHEGFGFHADLCAPGILALLEPIKGGTVVEVGCGSGLLTRYLTDAGHHVIGIDPSPAMLELARAHAPLAEYRLGGLPGELPAADAVVSIGHPLSYIATLEQLLVALAQVAQAVRPGGVLAIDLEDVSLLDHQLDRPPSGWVGDDMALVLERVSDGPNHFARLQTIFTSQPDGSYRRDFERHDNVLVDVDGQVRPLLEAEGLDVTVGDSFADEKLMAGLRTIVGHRPPNSAGTWSNR